MGRHRRTYRVRERRILELMDAHLPAPPPDPVTVVALRHRLKAPAWDAAVAELAAGPGAQATPPDPEDDRGDFGHQRSGGPR